MVCIALKIKIKEYLMKSILNYFADGCRRNIYLPVVVYLKSFVMFKAYLIGGVWLPVTKCMAYGLKIVGFSHFLNISLEIFY